MTITHTSDSATVGGTAHYIIADSTTKSLSALAGDFSFTIDWTNVAAGDEFLVEQVREINGTERTKELGRVIGANHPFTTHAYRVGTDGHDVRITKITGTDRVIPWEYSRDDGTVDVTKFNGQEFIDGTITPVQAMRGIIAALLGKVSGLPTAPVFRNVDDDKNVIDATTDTDGNRSAVTLDLT